MMESAFVRAARAGEAAVLSEIAWASKRHWGYSDEWMDKWRAALVISPAYLERNPVFVAEVCSTIAAFCAVVRTEAGWDLDHLWVRPKFIGQGIGSELFRHTVTFIQAQGQPAVLTIEAEPNAEAFTLVWVRCACLRSCASGRGCVASSRISSTRSWPPEEWVTRLSSACRQRSSSLPMSCRHRPRRFAVMGPRSVRS